MVNHNNGQLNLEEKIFYFLRVHKMIKNTKKMLKMLTITIKCLTDYKGPLYKEHVWTKLIHSALDGRWRDQKTKCLFSKSKEKSRNSRIYT